MARWIAEWMMISLIALLLVGLGLVLWMLLPALPAQLQGASLSAEGLLAWGLLAAVGLGFLKLILGR